MEDDFKEIGFIDEKYIQEADIIMGKSILKKTWIKIATTAACFVLILGIGILLAYNQGDTIKLTDASNKVSAKYVNNVPAIITTGDLVELSEKELFSKYDTAIFKGRILKVDNIQIDMNGQKEYRAVAQIKVEKVYRGDFKTEDTLSILLPCPINGGVWVEDTETVSSMKVGMTGIFMPIKYTEKSYYEANGAKLALKDIADYGFADGERYAFLEKDNNLIFAKWAYKSIEKATTLEEIEVYIEKMVK